MQKSNNEHKNQDEIIFHNPTTKDDEKHKLIFHEPSKRQFNFIEKQIRNNKKYAKLFINTKYAEALIIDTEEIPNSLYLTKIKNKTILEILVKKYGEVFKGLELERRIKENPEILEIYLKNNITPINYKNTDEYLLKKTNGITLLEYVLNNYDYHWKTDYANLESRIKTNKQINDIVVNYFIKQETLTQEQKQIIRCIIEYGTPDNRLKLYKKHWNNLKEDKILKEYILNNIDENTINFLIEIKEYDILKNNADTSLLNKKIDEHNTLFSFLIEKGIIKIESYYYKIEDLIKPIIENQMYETLEKIIKNNYDILLKKYDNTNSLLDLLISKKYLSLTLTDLWYNIKKLAKIDIRYSKILLKNDNWRDLLDASDSILDSRYDENTTYYEILTSKINEYLNSGDNYGYLSLFKISKRILLYKYENKTILEHLLQKGSKQTVLLNIEQKKLYSDAEIQTILKLNGIDLEKEFGKENENKYNIKYVQDKQKNEIIKELYAPFLKESISIEQQNLINQMKTFFSEDGKSDTEVITLACDAFKYSFLNNYKYTERDLNSLINIKKNNPEFIMIKEQRSHFDNMGILGISEIYNIDTFNHELAHAIHWYATENKISELFKNQQFEINEETYNKFIKNYVSEINIIIETIKQNNIDYYSENNEAQKSAKDYRKRIEEILDEAEKNNSYSKEIIDYLKENISIDEEYKMYYNKVSINEFSHLYIEDYKETIIDIIDALKKGKIYDEGIKINSSIIKQIGHGSDYYNIGKKDFEEIIANYNEIIKSPYKEEALKILEGIVGKELIEILEQFNEELVVEPLEHKKQR